MSIRRAVFSDSARLTELLLQVQKVHSDGRPDIFIDGHKKYSEEELHAIICDDEKPIFVYEEDGLLKGYAFCIYQVQEENLQLHYRKTLYIDDLCVDEVYRGQHVGSALYRHVVEVAKETGCHSVTLNVWALNEEAQKFYERMGLVPLKTTMENRL